MKNKFYLTRKKRTSFFVLLMVFSGFLCTSVQAQFSHRWNAASGDWNTVANWQVFTTTTDTPVLAGMTTTVVTFAGDITSTVAVGDFVAAGANGGTTNNNFVIGNTVTAISFSSPNTTVTMKLPMTVVAAAVNFRFQRPTTVGATVPNNALNAQVLIDSGVCTLTDTKAVRFIIVGNSDTTEGTLQIDATGVLNVNGAQALGSPTVPNVSVRGGLINNDGTIVSTAAAATGSPISISNGVRAIASGVWGITGAGILTLRNSGTNPASNGFFNIQQTASIAPEIWVNSGSTATLATVVAASGPFAMINLNGNAKARFRGVGFVGPASCPLFRPAAASFTLTIDSGVTFASTYASVASGITGTVTNNGTLVNDGLLPIFITTGKIDGTGTVVLKSNKLNPLILTLNTVAAVGAIAIGDTYTSGGNTYTVIEYARAATAAGAGGARLLVSTPSNKPLAAVSTLNLLAGSGPASIATTAVVQTGEGYITYDAASANTIKITQEHYLNSNQRGWRLLSNPLSDTTYGAVATASTTPITLGANTANTYDSANNIWVNANTNDTETWASKAAVSLFVRGRTSEVTATSYSVNPPSNVTLAITGTTTNAAPATVNTTAGRYYLVANPYTAPVSLFRIIAASTGLSNTVSYYNPTVGSNGTTDLILKKGGYDFPTISAAVAGDANDIVIPPMGAIFVLASVDGTINVPITAVFTGPALQAGTYNHKTAQAVVAATNDLKVEVSSADTYYDTVAFRFKTAGDAGSNIDFGKLSNTVLDAYSLVGSNKMAVSELELKDQLIPLGLSSTIEKSYAFKVVKNTIPAGYEAVLVDNLLNTTTVMTAGTSYSFAIDSNTASQGDARFAINLKTTGALSLDNQTLDTQIQMWPNPASGQVSISNGQNQNDGDSTIEISTINGKLIHSQKSNPGSTTTIQTNNWAKGVYILKAANKGSQTTKKLIIQ